jgi:processive 1,2-diacylglycerol beta-glucosyltransferase
VTERRSRILIFSASFGGGHQSAAEAMESYIRTHHPRTVDVRIVDFFKEFSPALNSIGKTFYDGSVHLTPDLYGVFFEVTNRMSDNPAVKDYAQAGFTQAANYIDEYGPDAVISTYPVAGGVVSEIRRTKPSLISAMVITDFGVHRQWLHPATDLMFVAGDDIRDELVSQGIDGHRVVASGIPIKERFCEPVDKLVARAELGLEDRFTILFTMAAGSTSDLRDVADGLVASDIQVVAVTGRAERLKRRLQTLQRRRPLLHVYGFTREMPRIMSASDVLIGKAGGLTVSEALAMGLPLIVHNPVPGQETFNADFLVNYGAGYLARDQDDVISKAGFMSRHPQRIAQMADNARALGRPDAARTVVERVLAQIDEKSAAAADRRTAAVSG